MAGYGERIVYFDMDGVMYDFDKVAGEAIPEDARVPRSTFYIEDEYPDYAQSIKDAYNDPDFFFNLPLAYGVIETFDAIYRSGRTPRILSTPLSSNPRSIEGKQASLRRDLVPHFGSRVLDEAIFEKHKWKHRGIILMEDRPDLPRGPEGLDTNPWEHVFIGWKYDRLLAPLTTASYRLYDFSNTAVTMDVIDRIEFSKK